ncbi:hypothetical protein LZK98_18615 [Sphingomonas cannabina]|uniref:hypothetical protein n=1 Tax=Sphingomonas cannabina TaxID=2899123 RepID=UPI001F2C7E6C|nr:hypothetical protein [Sphingomonas cannabina]UIJ45036.1 hypothetical protein LZK98_18615 [Sphingomonas cannabina]
MARRSDRTRSSRLTTAAIGAGLIGAGALAFAWWRRNATGGIFGTPEPDGTELDLAVRDGHPAPDLDLDRPRPGPRDRAPDAFRPDGDAPVPPEERDALRPALARPDRQLADSPPRPAPG